MGTGPSSPPVFIRILASFLRGTLHQPGPSFVHDCLISFFSKLYQFSSRYCCWNMHRWKLNPVRRLSVWSNFLEVQLILFLQTVVMSVEQLPSKILCKPVISLQISSLKLHKQSLPSDNFT